LEPHCPSFLGDGTFIHIVKVAFINDSIYLYASGDPSAVGGAERQQWLLARALAAAGWAVVVGISGLLKVGERVTIENVEFVGIGRGRAHVISAWHRFLASERPSWLYWRGASHLLGPAFAMAKMLGIHTIFAAALDPDVNPRKALFRRRHWWRLFAWGLSCSDRIFVQHGGQLNNLASHLRGRSYIVPSIAGETITVKPHRNREQYIAWVGQLKAPKRPDLLLEIARGLPHLRFIVCGGPTSFMSLPGYSARIIDELAALSNVEYLGQVAPSTALHVISDAAILLSTADEEGFPNTFLQAWTSGTPVVTLKVDPEGNIARNALGSVSASVESAASAIQALIDAPNDRDAIAARAVQYIQQCHSEEVVMQIFSRCLEGDPIVRRDLLAASAHKRSLL
jgi:glycosyltransferase involved in cell wall biosynthesis